jgi:hypothetical protein
MFEAEFSQFEEFLFRHKSSLTHPEQGWLLSDDLAAVKPSYCAFVMLASAGPGDAMEGVDPSRDNLDGGNTVIAMATDGGDTKYAQWTLRRDSDGTGTADFVPLFLMVDRTGERHIRPVLFQNRDEWEAELVAATQSMREIDIGPTGEHELVETLFRNLQGKFVIAETMRHRIRNNGTIAYGFISENWSAPAPPLWTPGQQFSVTRHQQRFETVIVKTSDRRCVQETVRKIRRDSEGRAVALDEFLTPEGRTTCRFDWLLDDGPDNFRTQ